MFFMSSSTTKLSKPSKQFIVYIKCQYFYSSTKNKVYEFRLLILKKLNGYLKAVEELKLHGVILYKSNIIQRDIILRAKFLF